MIQPSKGPITTLGAHFACRNVDADDSWSIGIAGPVSPDLLKSIALVGPGRVADAVHSVIGGPFDSAAELLAAVGQRR